MLTRRIVATAFVALVALGLLAPAAEATGRCWLYFDRDGEPYIAC